MFVPIWYYKATASDILMSMNDMDASTHLRLYLYT